MKPKNIQTVHRGNSLYLKSADIFDLFAHSKVVTTLYTKSDKCDVCETVGERQLQGERGTRKGYYVFGLLKRTMNGVRW